MNRQWTITAVRAGLCILSVGLGAGRAGGLATYWQHDPAEPGDWFAAGNWTGGVPGADDYACIANGGEARISGRAGTADTLWLGQDHDDSGTLRLGDSGGLSAAVEIIAAYGTGRFTQTGGTNEIEDLLSLGYQKGGHGTYELGGGELSTQREAVGDQSAGMFIQTGGTNAVSDKLYVGHESGSEGTFQLSGDGQLSAYREYVGDEGKGTFVQTGGSNTTRYLWVNSASRYDLSGGILTATDSAEVLGPLTFANGNALVTMGGLVNLGYAGLTGAGSTSFTLMEDSLLVVPAGFEPANDFGTFINYGCPVLRLGSSVTIPPDKGFSGTGTVEGHITCQGTIQHVGSIDIRGGLDVSGSGSVDLGYGTLTVEDTVSGVSDTGQLSGDWQYIGREGNGTFTQTGGSNTVAYRLYVGYKSGSEGAYHLSGNGQLSAGTQYIAYEGNGTFAQTGGTNTARNVLYLGYSSGSEGTYELSGTGKLTAGYQYIGSKGKGTFMQTGGSNTVSGSLYLGCFSGSEGTFTQTGGTNTLGNRLYFGRLYLGYYSDSEGTYHLNGTGQLSADTQYIGYQGNGTFTQPGGSNTVGDRVYLGYDSDSEGTYHLSGTGQLSAGTQYIAYEGNGTFTQTGGTNTVGEGFYLGYSSDSEGAYHLNGTGQLSADTQYIGYQGNGTFTQAGGTNTVGYLSVNRESRYELRGGTLTVTGGAEVLGALDFAQGNASAIMGGLVNLGHAGLSGAGSTSFTLKEDSLLVVPADFDPANDFGTFINYGCPLLRLGSSVTIPAEKGFSGNGTVEGHVACGGTIRPGTEEDIIDIVGGLSVSGSGSVDLGAGTLTVEDTVSGVTDTGQLSAGRQYIGYLGKGTFTQLGGSNTVGNRLYFGRLYVGYSSGSAGTYHLNGTGQLSADVQYIGSKGKGTFTQTGGTNTVGGLYVGCSSGSEGKYQLNGNGQLSAGTQYIGYEGNGTFTQTGGTNTVSDRLYVGCSSGSEGTYHLNGKGHLSAGAQYIGYRGNGTFMQTGGTNSTGYLSVNRDSRYELRGGTLTVADSAELLGTLDFAEGNASVTMAGVVILADASLIGGGSATFTLNPDSLLIVWPGFDPATEFGTFTNHGSIIHERGSALVVPAGQGFTGIGLIEDHVTCQGAINATTDKQISLEAGLAVAGSGSVNLGSGTLTVEDSGSGISGTGQLWAGQEYVGRSTTGRFTHSGGTNTIDSYLYLGSDPSAEGTYYLSGSGQLSTQSEHVGYYGTGTFTQTGGTHTVGDYLCLGYKGSATGTYVLSGSGELSTQGEYVGYYGTGTFTQTGGTHTVGDYLRLGSMNSGTGTYALSGTGQLSTQGEYVGCSGAGTFTQTGGTHTVGDQLYLGHNDSATGTYALSGSGQLSAQREYIGYHGRGMFTQTGGTNTVSDHLRLGYWGGSQGSYVIAGGYLAADNLHVGDYGDGELGIIGAEAEICIRGRLIFSGNSLLTAVPGSTIHMIGAALENKSRNADSLSGLANLRLLFEGGGENVAPLEIAGRDLGPVMDGFQRNFALGTLQVGGTGVADVQLVDQYDNQLDWTTEALYCWNLDVGPGSRLDLNGLGLYYFRGLIDPAATITGGTPLLIPEPTTLALCALGMLMLILWMRKGSVGRGGSINAGPWRASLPAERKRG